MAKLHPRLAKTRALSTATLDDEIEASDLTQFQLGELVGIDDRAVRRLLDPDRKRADRLDLLMAIKAVVGSIPTSVSTGAGCDSGDGDRGLVPSQVVRREERSQTVSQQTCSFGNESAGSRVDGNAGAADLLRAAAATQAPTRSVGAHCTALPGPLVAETAKAAPLGGDEASPQGLLGRAANLTGAPASHVFGESPDEETAAAAAELAPRGRRAA